MLKLNQPYQKNNQLLRKIKMKKIEISVPDGTSGDWMVQSFVVEKDELSQVLSMLKTGRGVPSGNYKKLVCRGEVVMSNTPDEIRDFMGFVNKAKGRVLVNGLGIGVLLKALLEKPEVEEIIVIEKSQDVINLVASSYSYDSRVKIIHADAFEYCPPKGIRYNAVWHDIWNTISAENLPEMKKLHRKYGRLADFQMSWCRDICERQDREEKKYDSYYGAFKRF